MKKFILITLLCALTVFACNDKDEDDDTDDPKNQTATRTLAHGVGTVTVQGYMTNAQWNGVPDKIATRINNQVGADITQWGEQATVDSWKPFFDRGIVFIVEPNPVGYSAFKTTGDGKTIYIALDKIDTTFVSSGMEKAASNETYIG